MKKFYVANCERDGDIFELLVTNNRFAAEERVKEERKRMSDYDLSKSRLYVTVYEAKDLERDYPDIGIDAHPDIDEWDRLMDEYDIVDEIYC